VIIEVGDCFGVDGRRWSHIQVRGYPRADNQLGGARLVQRGVNSNPPKLSPQPWSVGRKAQCARSRQSLAVSCGGGEASVISGVGPGGRRPYSPTASQHKPQNCSKIKQCTHQIYVGKRKRRKSSNCGCEHALRILPASAAAGSGRTLFCPCHGNYMHSSVMPVLQTPVLQSCRQPGQLVHERQEARM
jgi:hypothetical protein